MKSLRFLAVATAVGTLLAGCTARDPSEFDTSPYNPQSSTAPSTNLTNQQSLYHESYWIGRFGCLGPNGIYNTTTTTVVIKDDANCTAQ